MKEHCHFYDFPNWLEESYYEEWKNAGYGDVNELHREVPL
jgi:hypothetical protein